ncbi:MAG TPA: ABC transporter permease [Thermotogaceae bacterium]|nr:ABC transporter permease [Thermotogaceae bacterium]
MSNRRIRQFYSIFVSFAKDSLRDKLETFFSILFPILFFILFGFIFGNESDYLGEKIGFFVTNDISEDIERKISNVGAWKTIMYDSVNSLRKAVENGEILLGVYLHGSKVEFLYYMSDPSRNTRIQMIMTTISTFLLKIFNEVEDVLTVEKIPVKVGKVASNQMSYLTAGVLAVSLLTSGMFSMITLFGNYKRRALLKRVIASPVNTSIFIFGSTLTKLLMSFISVFIVILIGSLIFNLKYSFNWPLFLLSIVSSALGMMAFGILLLILFKRPEAAQTAGSVLMTLMIFFSGVYFPIEFLPKSLRSLSIFLPVKYVAQILRYTAGVENMKLSTFFTINFTLLISGIFLISITGKLFLKAK